MTYYNSDTRKLVEVYDDFHLFYFQKKKGGGDGRYYLKNTVLHDGSDPGVDQK